MSETAIGYLAIAGSAVLLCLTILAWAGVWRRWASQILLGLNGMPLPLTLLPALGLMLLAGGLASLDIVAASSAISVVLFLVALALIGLFLWAPSWLGPRWYRDEMRSGGTPDLHDPVTAIAIGTMAENEALPSELFEGRTPVQSWNATWIFGDEFGDKPHALARAGAVSGTLRLYREGIAFVPLKMEASLREEALSFALTWSEIRGVRSVPSRCGPDGQKRQGPLFRSWWPRLVVDATSRPYLLEVMGARKKIDVISVASQGMVPA